MTYSRERSAFIKRADDKILPVTVRITDNGSVRVADATQPQEHITLWKLVFGDSPPKTPEEKLEYLQDDSDIYNIHEDSRTLRCKGCSRTLLFEFPHRMNVASWLRHKVTCPVVQRHYETQYTDIAGDHHQVKQEEEESSLMLMDSPRRIFIASTPPKRAPTKKALIQENERRKFLEDDPLISRVEEDRVLCRPCARWIGGTMGKYSLVNWRCHRKAKHASLESSTSVRHLAKSTSVYIAGGKVEIGPRHSYPRNRPTPSSRLGGAPRKRRRIESDDFRELSRKIIKTEQVEESWFAKVASGVRQIWSVFVEAE